MHSEPNTARKFLTELLTDHINGVSESSILLSGFISSSSNRNAVLPLKSHYAFLLMPRLMYNGLSTIGSSKPYAVRNWPITVE